MFKRYELHNHTTQSDAFLTCQELYDRMVADGVDCFAITDHNTISGQPIFRKILADKNSTSIQCLYGMEYTTYYGHIVCPVLETYVPWDSINRHKPELLFEACKKAGGITGIAHPFAYGPPFAQGCRLEMTVTDFSNVDYMEIVNNPEPMREVNSPAIRWWEKLVLDGVRLAACAGMDLHYKRQTMDMKFATYIEGEPGGDALAELRAALAVQRTWISKGMLVNWTMEGDGVRFELCDVKKPGFVPSETYTMTLKNKDGVRSFDLTGGSLTLPLSELADIEIPMLYGGEVALENLICVAPVIRK